MAGLGILALIFFGIWLIPIPIAYIGYQQYEYDDPEGRPIVVLDPLPVYDFIVVGAGSSGFKTNLSWTPSFHQGT